MIKKIRFKARVVDLPRVCGRCGNIHIADVKTATTNETGKCTYYTRYRYCTECGWKSDIHVIGDKPPRTIIRLNTEELIDDFAAINSIIRADGV